MKNEEVGCWHAFLMALWLLFVGLPIVPIYFTLTALAAVLDRCGLHRASLAANTCIEKILTFALWMTPV